MSRPPVHPLVRGRYPPFRVVLIFSVLILGLASVASSIPVAHATGTLYISPADQGPFPVNSLVTYKVKVANIDPFNFWDVMVKTDASILDPQKIDISGNVITANFSDTMTELGNCIDGSGSGCTINDGGGTAHSQVVQGSYGTPVTGPISGLLFTITYKVMTTDMTKYSLLNIVPTFDLLLNKGSSVVHADVGGIYGKPPLFPVADFKWSPNAPSTEQAVNFTAVNVSDPNPGATIVRYTWEFFANQRSNSTDTTVPTIIHVFPLNDAGNASVTLRVTDSLGIPSLPVSHIVTVTAKAVLFPIVSLTASSTDNILPGTIVTLTVSVVNDGNQPINGFNLTLYLDRQVRNHTAIKDALPRSSTKTFQYRLDTSTWKPDSYEVLASIPPLPGQTDFGNNNATIELRVIYPYPGGLQASLIPLTIPEFSGLVIGVLVALGILKFTVDQARRRRRLRAEELA